MFGVPGAERHAAAARELSLGFLHWLQTEGGLPGLRLRGDVVGDTPDGLAKALYIRESRRIRGETTVLEQELGRAYPDSVGIGQYRIDLHPSTGGRRLRRRRLPAVPAAARRADPRPDRQPARGRQGRSPPRTSPTAPTGCTRSSGTSGEAAGHLAAFCSARRTTPRAVRAGAALLREFQAELAAAGVELAWPPGVAAY